MTKQELPPQGQELGQELPPDATSGDGLKPDGKQQGPGDGLQEELVPVSQLDALRASEQAQRAKVERELQRALEANRALQLGQSQAAASLGAQLGQDPAVIARTINDATAAEQLRQFQARQAAETQKEYEVGWWAGHFREFGIDPDTAPEFAQAYMHYDNSNADTILASRTRFTEALKNAHLRTQQEAAQKEERDRRFTAAQGVQKKADEGQFTALDESGMALPPKAPFADVPLNAGTDLIRQALQKPLPRRKQPGGE